MVIKYFIFTLLVLSISFYFTPLEEIKKYTINNDAPVVIFESPSMFTMNEKGFLRVIYANKALRYKDRDEIYNGNITINNLDDNQKFNSENLKADLIIKKENKYVLTDDVKYTRDNFIKVNTNELYYDDIDKIANNTKAFDAIYNNHYLKGDTFYIDINNDFTKAKNTHFEIEITKKN